MTPALVAADLHKRDGGPLPIGSCQIAARFLPRKETTSRNLETEKQEALSQLNIPNKAEAHSMTGRRLRSELRRRSFNNWCHLPQKRLFFYNYCIHNVLKQWSSALLKREKGKQCNIICPVVQQEEGESIPPSNHGCTIVQSPRLRSRKVSIPCICFHFQELSSDFAHDSIFDFAHILYLKHRIIVWNVCAIPKTWDEGLQTVTLVVHPLTLVVQSLWWSRRSFWSSSHSGYPASHSDRPIIHSSRPASHSDPPVTLVVRPVILILQSHWSSGQSFWSSSHTGRPASHSGPPVTLVVRPVILVLQSHWSSGQSFWSSSHTGRPASHSDPPVTLVVRPVILIAQSVILVVQPVILILQSHWSSGQSF
ncbi:hypothetical protein ANN_25854 [Periplaneta americana]|uniref:Uncharacterized protein n=1 Tax=Periplaneta americana TaxID=6978 RepID=A0ABQ8S4C4_PERAM|nr:hypothetical protein ANN_25854 [Periplaneta americana]